MPAIQMSPGKWKILPDMIQKVFDLTPHRSSPWIYIPKRTQLSRVGGISGERDVSMECYFETTNPIHRYCATIFLDIYGGKTTEKHSHGHTKIKTFVSNWDASFMRQITAECNFHKEFQQIPYYIVKYILQAVDQDRRDDDENPETPETPDPSPEARKSTVLC